MIDKNVTFETYRYACTELEVLRDMPKTLDFRDLQFALKNLEKHLNTMSKAFKEKQKLRNLVNDIGENNKLSNKEKAEAIADAYKDYTARKK